MNDTYELLTIKLNEFNTEFKSVIDQIEGYAETAATEI
jgi:hypothetical protein